MPPKQNKIPKNQASLNISQLAGTSGRLETETHIIYLTPRISASLLGQYIVADPSRQKTILKNSKFCRKGMAFGYAKARHAVSMSVKDGVLDREEIARRAQALKEDLAGGMAEKENLLSATALNEFSKMQNFPEIDGVTKIPRPKTGWDKLFLSGVQITFEPQLVFSVPSKGTSKVGGLIFHPTKSVSLNKEQNGVMAGEYTAVLLLKMLEEELAAVGVPLPSKCLVADVFRDEVHVAPKSYKTLLKHMSNACEAIAALWPSIKQ